MLVGFKAEFVNFNQDLRDRYSNYYVDTMPLFLAEDDISFTLYNINFDNIAKLLQDTPQAVLGITVQVNLVYEVRFKGLQARDNIESLETITNDLDVLNKIQDNIEEYFTNFVNKVLKDQNYQIIMPKYVNQINPGEIIWDIVTEDLKKQNILFFGTYLISTMSYFKVLFIQTMVFLKSSLC
ncbi:hypothetical protein [Spiroplasma endosymbiont of Poecilobothrus nobilitatus]|uniref:hypothetical protein n=1 Tax=Spiroplasma endosymbiont of Poecilobothrus nobilitatus TaxID=1209220 RepID=UPI00313C3C6C